jgi:hypothetical protein
MSNAYVGKKPSRHRRNTDDSILTHICGGREHIYAMGVDATGSMLVCTTERFYGSYDLSNQCLLLRDDEVLVFDM